MDLTVRPITRDEVDAFRLTLIRTFGEDIDLEDDDRRRRFFELFEIERSVAAFDGATIVGTGGAFSFDLTVPGGSLPMAGTTIVTVRPTHRRRGVLRAMMRTHLDEVRDRGEPLAGLWASEAPIYGRFGFGAATDRHDLAVDGRTVQLSELGDTGSVELIEPHEAPKYAPALYEAYRPLRPGALSRSEAWWANRKFHDPTEWRDGASSRRWVLYLDGGEPQGYVAFRQKENWEANHPNGKVDVIELIANTDGARAGLWRFLLSVDLFPNVAYWNAPVDEPLTWLVDNRRRVSRKTYEGLWLRIMDVPGALAGRRYGGEGRLVISVRDGFCPWNEGTYELVVTPEGAECSPTDATPDLELDVADLGSIYLGGHRASTLAAAGRIRGDAAAIARADRLFGWPVAPWCPEVF